jgi:plastocyanin
MQRFRLMNLYAAFVVLLVTSAIAAATLIRPAEAAATPADTDLPHVTAAVVEPAADSASASIKSSKQLMVAIDNFKFTPSALSVSVGDTITWVNRDDVPHTATSKDDPAAFDSKALDTDDKFSFTFTKPGTYKYYCKVHTHMTGSITVK